MFWVLLVNEAKEETGELLPWTQRELADHFEMSWRRIGERLQRLREANLIRYDPDRLQSGGSVIGIVDYERITSIAGAGNSAAPGAAEQAAPGRSRAAAGAAIGAAIVAADPAPPRAPWPAGSPGETYETYETEETTTTSSARVRARDDRESSDTGAIVAQRMAELDGPLTQDQAHLLVSLARREASFRRERLPVSALIRFRTELLRKHGRVRGDGVLTESLRQIAETDRGEPVRDAMALLRFKCREVETQRFEGAPG
jgi:hypothetical protein